MKRQDQIKRNAWKRESISLIRLKQIFHIKLQNTGSVLKNLMDCSIYNLVSQVLHQGPVITEVLIVLTVNSSHCTKTISLYALSSIVRFSIYRLV